MITYGIMIVILLFLAGILLVGAQYRTDTKHFFDIDNTNALRGFWCLIVVLVHIPVVYQNPIQDMIGSFAYIGVTFFFMTSAYGLRLAVAKKPDSINHFWVRRLPKLLIPCFIINCINVLCCFIEGTEFNALRFIQINDWVQWLLVCYFIFWVIYRFGGGYRDQTICVLVALFSLTVYVFKSDIQGTTWCPEIFGFIWGIALFRFKDKLLAFVENKWAIKCVTFCSIAGVLGVGYLKFKTVEFLGDYLLKILLGMAITVFILVLNSHICIGNKVNQVLGRISFEVYLLHGIVFGLLENTTGIQSSGVFILLSLIVTVIIAYFVKCVCGLIDKNLFSKMIIG